MPELAAQIARNVAEVRQRIAAAADRCDRRAEEVTLVAVTKGAELDAVRALVAAGCTELAESRPQQLWERAAQLADLPIRWHLIGHLQRNKVRRTLPLLTMIHAGDSPRLIAAIDEAAAELTLRVPILLELNVSGEPAKHGFAPDEAEPFLEKLADYRHVEVRGLMCMAALEGGLQSARRDFAALRHVRDRLSRNCPSNVVLRELSMGMSDDFEVAIEEGATMVRIGSALFAGVTP